MSARPQRPDPNSAVAVAAGVKGSYAVVGTVDKIGPVDLLGCQPRPVDLLNGPIACVETAAMKRVGSLDVRRRKLGGQGDWGKEAGRDPRDGAASAHQV